MKLNLTRFLLLIIITVLSVTGCSRSSNVKKFDALVLKAPGSAEFGDIIPLSLELPEYIKSGSSITIFANSEPAVTVKLLDGYKTNKFSTRVRMMHSGSIVAKVTKSNGDVQTVFKKVTIDKGAKIPETGLSNNEYRYEYVDGDLKLMIGSQMSTLDSIKKVLVRTNQGKLEIDCTLNLSKFPYFALSHDGPIQDFTIEIY